jgi:hypothetical protein
VPRYHAPWGPDCFIALSADRRGDFRTALAQIDSLIWRDGGLDGIEMKAWARWVQSAIDQARGSLLPS